MNDTEVAGKSSSVEDAEAEAEGLMTGEESAETVRLRDLPSSQHSKETDK